MESSLLPWWKERRL